MTHSFGGIFNNSGHGGSYELRVDWSRETPHTFFAQVERLLAELAEQGLVALTTIELDVAPGKFPDVLTTFFYDENWDHQDRWTIGEACKDDRANTWRHGRFTFESRRGLTARLLTLGEGVRWGAPLRLGGVLVAESDVAGAVRQSPFDAAGADVLAGVSRSAWAATKDLDGLAVWVQRSDADIIRRIRSVLETA